jgi:hypothetical protein
MTELTKIWEKNDQKISDMKISNEKKNSITEIPAPVSPMLGDSCMFKCIHICIFMFTYFCMD